MGDISSGGDMGDLMQAPPAAAAGEPRDNVVAAAQQRMSAVRELQETNARLREELAEVQVLIKGDGATMNNLSSLVKSLQSIIMGATGVDVKAAMEEKHAESVISQAHTEALLVEKNKLIALEKLEAEKIRDDADRLIASKDAAAAKLKEASSAAAKVAAAPKEKKKGTKKGGKRKSVAGKAAKEDEVEEEEEDEPPAMAMPALPESRELKQAEEGYKAASDSAAQATEKADMVRRLAEAASTLASDSRAVAQATAEKARLTIEQAASQCAEACVSDFSAIKSANTAMEEEKKNLEGSANAMQIQIEALKREKTKLSDQIKSREGEVAKDLKEKGGKLQGMMGQVGSLEKQLQTAEESLLLQKAAAEKREKEQNEATSAALLAAATQLEEEQQTHNAEKAELQAVLGMQQKELERLGSEMASKLQLTQEELERKEREAKEAVTSTTNLAQEQLDRMKVEADEKEEKARQDAAERMAKIMSDGEAEVAKMKEDAEEKLAGLRAELEEQYRKEVKELNADVRSKRAEASSLMESELQAAEVERDALERKAREMVAEAKQEKKAIERKCEQILDKALAEREAMQHAFLEERRKLQDEIRVLKTGKVQEAEVLVKEATVEKQKAFAELQSVQKQRAREAENATKSTKIALNTLRREKEALQEQVKHWMQKADEMREQMADLRDKTNEVAFEHITEHDRIINELQGSLTNITKALGKLEVIMKPLTEKVNALHGDLEIIKASQRGSEDQMISGLEKLEKDLRDKVQSEMRRLDREMKQEMIEVRKSVPQGSQACVIM
ncbi:hypothetical protein CYMTET_54143 [Cymbomonas tetramitiformis]|uniref:Uncharacterized protein n=1 Tax=Cymbomonas tetramitiformis TaxID=36881 RepID=A0AAE0BGX8_9CHLO|nr:hypothetical protein CYMTET_54143 [Cymbomonas tetramitiformis]